MTITIQNRNYHKASGLESHPFKGIPRTVRGQFYYRRRRCRPGAYFTYSYRGIKRFLDVQRYDLDPYWVDFPGTENVTERLLCARNIAYVGTGYTPSTKNRADEFHHDFYAYDPSTGKWSDTPVTYLPPDAQAGNARKDAIALTIKLT